ncbi:hypothetical protein J437_LFUL012527 [Ladona fulva]|uniref:Ubiquitin-like domain-containing protein n=1 Tax=Ladona fulva TaxID=123851 RepID=A0A8K0P687_LADFU|nr:hypothetical protein J437_LFUL012527 [Ladona fulva]
MYVKVRLVGSRSKDATVTVSKLTTVKQFKELIEEETKVEPEKQRLFYKGKQLEDEYKLFDYNINLNDVVQLMVRNEIKPISKENAASQKNSKDANEEEKEEMKHGHRKSCWKSIPASLYFKAGDYVDVRSESNGAWFEGQILDILANVACECCGAEVDTKRTEKEFGEDTKLQEDIIYVVTYDKCAEEFVETKLENIRPKARTICDITSLKEGSLVLVNYNLEEPNTRGQWYDFRVNRVTRSGKSVFGDILISSSNFNLKECRVKFVDEIMKIEERVPVKDRSKKMEESMKDSEIIDIERLISLVEEQPVLWDKTLESDKDRIQARNAWIEIFKQLNQSFEDINNQERNEYGK